MTDFSVLSLQLELRKDLQRKATEEDKRVLEGWLGRMLYGLGATDVYGTQKSKAELSGEAQFTAYALIDMEFHGIQDDTDYFAKVITTKGEGIKPWKFHLFIDRKLTEYSFPEIYQTLRHEVGHVFLLHGIRYPSEVAKYTEVMCHLWNFICDAVMDHHTGITKVMQTLKSKIPVIPYDELVKLAQGFGKYISNDQTEERIFKLLLAGIEEEIKNKVKDPQLQREVINYLKTQSVLPNPENKNSEGSQSGENNPEQGGTGKPNATDSQSEPSSDPTNSAPKQSTGGDTSESDNLAQGIIDEILQKLLQQKIMRDLQGVVVDETGATIELNEAVKKSLEAEIVARVENAGRAAGHTPGKIKEFVEKLQEPPVIRWEQYTRQGIQASIKVKKSVSPTRINNKLGFGFGKSKSKGPRALFMMDTSGSMSSDVLMVGVNELFRLYSMAEAYLVQYDHGLQGDPIRITRGLQSKFGVLGRGGTSVDTAIKQLKEKFDITQFDAVYIFTDFGDSTSIKESPFGRASVHWFKTDNGYLNPSWGTIVDISKQIQETIKRSRKSA